MSAIRFRHPQTLDVFNGTYTREFSEHNAIGVWHDDHESVVHRENVLSRYDYRENTATARLLAPVHCRCGEDLRAGDEYIGLAARFFPNGNTKGSLGFYYFCVPCGLDVQFAEQQRDERMAAFRAREGAACA